MTNALKSFVALSGREQRVGQLISQYTDLPVETVLDPTLTVPETYWEEKSEKRLIEEDYILCYFLYQMLKDEGYDVSNKTITTTSTSKTTIINKTDVDTKFTDNIKDLLGVGNVSTSSVSSSDVDITIIIGKDYK